MIEYFKRLINQQKQIQDLQSEVEVLRNQPKTVIMDNFRDVSISQGPVGKELADFLKDEVLNQMRPILKETVLRAVSKIDWNDFTQTKGYMPSFKQAFNPYDQVHVFHLTLPELNLKFNAVLNEKNYK